MGRAEKMYAAGVPVAEAQHRYLTAGDTATLAGSGSYAAAFLKEAGTSSVMFFTTLAGEPATTQLDGTL